MRHERQQKRLARAGEAGESGGGHRGRPVGAGILQVLVGDEHGRAGVAPGLGRWLAGVAPAGVRGTVGVALVSGARVRVLNRRYRGHDEATDVLSFPVDAADRRLGRGAVGAWLGDIVIARDVARRQARAAGHSERTELRVLALHGLLHLLGYDHEQDAGRMRRVEERLRLKGGLREGLIARAPKK